MKDNHAPVTIGGFTLLPPPADCCQECGVKHPQNQAHNASSLHYQYHFYGEHGRWPTWKDAIAHLTPEQQEVWRVALKKYGVVVEP